MPAASALPFMVLCLKILPLGGSETDIPTREKTDFCSENWLIV